MLLRTVFLHVIITRAGVLKGEKYASPLIRKRLEPKLPIRLPARRY